MYGAESKRTPGDEPLSSIREPELGDMSLVLAVCDVLRDLLAIESVMPDDNFFRCGGHSLLAVRLISRLDLELGLHLTLRQLLEQPTARAMVAVASTEARESGASERPSLRRRT